MRHINCLAGISIGVLVIFGTVVISPNAGLAQSGDLSLVLNADSTSDFWQLMAEAESIVVSRIAQVFANNPAMPGVTIEVLVERNGAVVPLMTTQVARANWQQDARLERWTQYFANAQVLLSYVPSSDTDVSNLTESTPIELENRQQRIQLEDALD